MTLRKLQRIIATTDVHSALDTATGGMLAHLHALKATSLIADCGDFFEGTGYYHLGKGQLERETLTSLYDVLAPGNHGWPHYFEPDLHSMTVCANAVAEADGKPLFARLRIVRVRGRRVAVSAIMGPQAFNTIPAHQRGGHQVTEPAAALRQLMLEHHHRADSWIVLSHSGFTEDLKLAAACPFADVIFAGHCHSENYGPINVGDTLVLKGAELGAGYALAEPGPGGWAARTTPFPPASHVPDDLTALHHKIAFTGRMLTKALGTVNKPYRNTELDRGHLLAEIATRLRTGLGADAVLINETALRPVHLGVHLTLADLLAIEPFDNQLVHAFLPEEHTADPGPLLDHLAEQVGPVTIAPRPLPSGSQTVLTTEYLANTFLDGRTHQAGLRLGQAVRRTVATPLPDETDEAAR
ncbi:bifunctional metallophosphatase/5'-nucleotidase [Streptomyces sp. NBC_00063]|uniref:bifunctional metallophosphatase/5'-nucleotidase n=1 Tax=Streptomyces sp. NBC_00063 TaxID=2975638 RepID=UPI00224F4A3B|nr:bifunctional metallophosphatase/5'-nucleotidase [Streptomyces sp. NBC_00063]MCX5441253.1 bifunctional metallophosphatase/5'-nucleotidase [Streptomyces sp. NBC_00063]